ncbi:hypothetical protein BIV19_12270 [Intestinimonas butyriciproducens]|nr:hypothetical protein BIV19_12270 [Intestinimonas butyriciproducens]
MVPGPGRQKDAVLLLIQLERGHEGLGGDLHSPQAPHFLFLAPGKASPSLGTPIPISFARAE